MVDEHTNNPLETDDSHLGVERHTAYASMRPGQLLLQRYLILSVLGRGGMGTVFRVRDELAGIDLALKALPPKMAMNFSEMKTVRQNFRLVHDLNHPNIAALNTLEQDPETGAYYLLMECVIGEDLNQFRERHHGKQPLSFWLPMIAQVVDALDYAHHRKIIHRDIKPSNIFISDEGEVKLLDFGIASLARTTMHGELPEQATISGTASYMAPEQWQGIPQGTAADQYALAVSIYQLVSGRCPFVSDVAPALREAVLNEEPLKPNGMTNANWKVIKKALSKDPQQRYRSVGNFFNALENSCLTVNKNTYIWPFVFLILVVGATWLWRGQQVKRPVSTPDSPQIIHANYPIPPKTNPDSQAQATGKLEASSKRPSSLGTADLTAAADAMAADALAEEARDIAKAANAETFSLNTWKAAENKRMEGKAGIKFKVYDQAIPALREAIYLYAQAQINSDIEAKRQADIYEQELAEQRQSRHQALTKQLREVQRTVNTASTIRNEVPEVWREIQQDLGTSNRLAQDQKFEEASARLRNVLIRLKSARLSIRNPEAKSNAPRIADASSSAPSTATIRVTAPDNFTGDTRFEILHNGKSLGEVNLPHGPIKLDPGMHNFQIRGHDRLADSEARLINLKSGAKEVFDLSVPWRPAILKCSVNPTDAVIRIASEEKSARTIKQRRIEIKPGIAYTITASAAGFRTTSQTVKVEPGTTTPITLNLDKNPKISARP